MSTYTPDPGDVEELYVTDRHINHGVLREDGHAEFRRMLMAIRPNADDPAQVQTAAQAVLQGLRFVYDADDVPFDTDEGMSDYLAHEVLKALAEGRAS